MSKLSDSGNKFLTESQAIQSYEHSLSEDYNPSRVHILVVDDDAITRKIISNSLRKYQYNVTCVNSGTEAWTKLKDRTNKYDLVLTDVMMPAISGLTLLQMINDEPSLRHVPVILMSGTAIDSKTANDSIKIGGQDYLTKPIGKELLKRKIDMVLQNVYRQRKEQVFNSVLAQERQKGTIMAKQIDELKRKVNEMTQISKDAIESPLQSITRSIDSLLKDNSWSMHEDEIRNQLTKILRELVGTSNLYRPSFENLIHNDRVDPMTKSFLMTEFSDTNTAATASPSAHGTPSSVNTGRRSSIPTFPSLGPPRADRDYATYKTWEFDVFKHTEAELLPMIVDMFNTFQLLDLFRIDIKKLHKFILKVLSLYHKDNRYHNFVHAFDVTHASFSFLTVMNAQEYLTHLDILALLTASLCHDLDHPGFNNAYQVNAQTDLAILYNDTSVLESHHSSMTFTILKKADCNIFENLNEDQYKEIRRSIVSLILATDMANHFEYISKFTHHLQSHKFDRNKKEDRQMILNTLLKCADLSNAAKPWTLNYEWSNRVADEFFNQSAYEKEHKLPVAPFMDKSKTSKPRIASDFINFVASPIFRALEDFLPNASRLNEYLVINQQNWARKLEEVQSAASDDAATNNTSSTNNNTNNQDHNNSNASTTTTTTITPPVAPSTVSTPPSTPPPTPAFLPSNTIKTVTEPKPPATRGSIHSPPTEIKTIPEDPAEADECNTNREHSKPKSYADVAATPVKAAPSPSPSS